MKQIVLDTETTGISPKAGHRIIEIGAVELIDRQLTGRRYQQYLYPDREIDEGAQRVHGISLEFLKGKPRFADVCDEFLEFIEGSELIIHNAPFDLGFLNAELERVHSKETYLEDIHGIIDTLVMAREKHPGQKNNLDALCKRYNVDNSSRDLHGALLDSEILAEVYLAMTGGQVDLMLSVNSSTSKQSVRTVNTDVVKGYVLLASDEENQSHRTYLKNMEESFGVAPIFEHDDH
ncbi:MAG: DNA polymerase III subunit epsilon [Legionellales bacterium]|nr:DNA polymerase III subunit epsilon [Legionellales bacterium]